MATTTTTLLLAQWILYPVVLGALGARTTAQALRRRLRVDDGAALLAGLLLTAAFALQTAGLTVLAPPAATTGTTTTAIRTHHAALLLTLLALAATHAALALALLRHLPTPATKLIVAAPLALLLLAVLPALVLPLRLCPDPADPFPACPASSRVPGTYSTALSALDTAATLLWLLVALALLAHHRRHLHAWERIAAAAPLLCAAAAATCAALRAAALHPTTPALGTPALYTDLELSLLQLATALPAAAPLLARRLRLPCSGLGGDAGRAARSEWGLRRRGWRRRDDVADGAGEGRGKIDIVVQRSLTIQMEPREEVKGEERAGFDERWWVGPRDGGVGAAG